MWAGFFFGACIASFWNPIWGIVGYMGHYCVGPEKQWWAAPVNSLSLRYSFSLAACTAIGIALQRSTVSFREGLLHPQQKLILLFFSIVWTTTLFSPDTLGRYTSVDHPSVKFTKIIFFSFMLCHVATNLRDFNRVIGILVTCGFVLGFSAFEAPASAFHKGRLEGVGGADFNEANFLGAFLVGILPIIAAQFLNGRIVMKIICAVSGIFAANAIVLTRGRGAFLGLGFAAIVAVFSAPRQLRKKILIGMFVALLGGFFLLDANFLTRMTSITAESEERDDSANDRIETWKAGLQLIVNNPQGVGTGNWYQTIGKYNPKFDQRDSHSTYVKLAAEQGLLGALVFVVIVFNAFRTLRRVSIRSASLPTELSNYFQHLALGCKAGLAGMLLSGTFITILYMEALWWFLVLPVCLERTLNDTENTLVFSHDDNADQAEFELAAGELSKQSEQGART